jgi:hypothetical protein
MEDNGTQVQTEGQVESDSGNVTGTTDTSPETGTEQAVVDSGTSVSTPPSGEEVFFDYKSWQDNIKDLPDDQKKPLEAAFKQMQGAFTKKQQGLSKDRSKVEAYEAFMSNPMEQIQQVARQNGYNLVPQNAQPTQSQQIGQPNHSWDAQPPQTWDEVYNSIKDAAVQEAVEKFQGNLQPIMGNIQKLTTQNIEKQLDDLDPNWRIYEDTMKETLQKHPTMVSDVRELYRLSVPDDVINSRAYQQAIKKLEDKGKNAQTGQKSTSVKTRPASQKVDSFQDAVDQARAMLASQ